VSARYVDAAAFLDQASTMQTVSDQLVVQLNNRLTGFREAAEQVAADLTDEARARIDSFELTVVRPLQRCRQPGRRVNLLIDGFDQPEEGTRALLAYAIRTLTAPSRPELDHVRVIVAARGGTSGDPDLAPLGQARRIAESPDCRRTNHGSAGAVQLPRHRGPRPARRTHRRRRLAHRAPAWRDQRPADDPHRP